MTRSLTRFRRRRLRSCNSDEQSPPIDPAAVRKIDPAGAFIHRGATIRDALYVLRRRVRTHRASAHRRRPAPPAVDPITKGVPHGGQILRVAVTEQADAALTFDSVGGVRLWPTLDASRTPVPIAVIAPSTLGLAHAGRDLLATFLDEAGTLRVVRLGRDGSVRGDVQVRAEVPYEQVIALDDGVLARSEDQVVEWFSPDGVSRGRLVAEPSTRIEAIAARRGEAIAIVSDGTKHELRWLRMVADQLEWGETIALPVMVKGELVALSPSHRRIAVVDAKTSELSVYLVGLLPVRIGNPVPTNEPSSLGFIDDDRVAVIGSSMAWWSKPAEPSNDPWAVASYVMPTPSPMQVLESGAIADNLAVSSFGAHLALTNRDGVKYLGYKEHGVGNIGAAAGSLWVAMSGTHMVWLDDKLEVAREIELHKDQQGPWVYGTPIGDHHVVTQTPIEGKYKVELVDLEHQDTHVLLGTYPNVERIEYAADSGLLAVSTYTKLQRFAIDLAANTARELPAIKTRGSLATLRLLDPERAAGMTALTVGWDRDYDEDYTLTIHRTNAAPTKVRGFAGRVIDIDATGTLYVVNGNEIQVRRGSEKLSSFKVDGIGSPVAVNADGSRFAVLSRNDVVVLDAHGTEQWRKPAWGTAQLVFTRDGKHLAVRANGGLALLDTTTGERQALECGWSFALMTTPPMSNVLASAPVCEDPML